MIWIASFPRSGNTFLRNILYEVYGLESSTYHLDPDRSLDEGYDAYPFVKTHLLPGQLKPPDPAIPAIYLIRDGRDALCSIAHHRKDIIAPGSDYVENLKAAIIAEKGSFFGGWSKNVEEWIRRADMVMRFEDLIADPIGCTERLRILTDLPKPCLQKLPTFSQMKFGTPQYGSGKKRNIPEAEMKKLATMNFRRGQAGSWKTEMPPELHDLFWSFHGEMMERLGYGRDGEMVELHPELDHLLIRKLGQQVKPDKGCRILIEANKMASPDNDGVKRYQAGLLKAMWVMAENKDSKWKIDLYVNGAIVPLAENGHLVFRDFKNQDTGRAPMPEKVNKSLFQRFEEGLVRLVPDAFVAYLKRNDIRFFHMAYEGVKKTVFGLAEFLIHLFRFAFGMLYRLKERIADRDESRLFRNYDMIHLPLMQHYRAFRKTRLPLLVTIHDMTHRYFPQFHTSINISNAENGLRFIQKKQADILAVSESTLNDCLSECGLSGEKIHLVYEAVESQKFRYRINAADNAAVLEKYGIGIEMPYLLCLSTIEPRKNLSNTIKAFSLLLEELPESPVNLVIAGKRGWASDKMFLHNKVLSERIIFTGFVDDNDLSALYTNAIALCYVSYYEGFGLPPLEAMRCMTPVIYGNNSSMPEIIGEGGLAADPDDPDDIRKQMQRLLTDHALREAMGKAALHRSLDFSWRKTLLETMDIYQHICNRNRK